MNNYKSATIFHREHTFYVRTFVKTDTGLDVGAGPYLTFDTDVVAGVLGAAVKKAVWRSFTQEPIPHPDNFSDHPKLNEFLSVVGCSSWGAFAKKAVACDVTMLTSGPEKGNYYVEAEIADKRGGFSNVGEEIELPSDVTDEALGEAVMERLKWAREQT